MISNGRFADKNLPIADIFAEAGFFGYDTGTGKKF